MDPASSLRDDKNMLDICSYAGAWSALPDPVRGGYNAMRVWEEDGTGRISFDAADIGAPVLRTAHARSEALGLAVHYSQQDAEHTNFKAGSFDLITSSMFLHETARKAVHNIVKECYRLLAPGGIMVHVEQPPFAWAKSPFDQMTRDWDTHNNNEPFWGTLHDSSPATWLTEAGYDREMVRSVWTRRNANGVPEFVPAGIESRITGAQLFGARK